MILKFKLILIFSCVPLISVAQDGKSIPTPDSIANKLNDTTEKQNKAILKLDSTITQQKNENAYLKELAEQDIDHAKSLVSVMEIILGFIAALLAIFTVVGA